MTWLITLLVVALLSLARCYGRIRELRGLLGGANIRIEQLKETVDQLAAKDQVSESTEVRRLEGELEKVQNELFEFTDPSNWETVHMGSKGTFLMWNGKRLKLDHGPRLSEKQTENLITALEETSGRAT